MKKLLALCLALLMVFSLIGCSEADLAAIVEVAEVLSDAAYEDTAAYTEYTDDTAIDEDGWYYSADDVTEYIVENHIECLDRIKGDDRWSREIVILPTMPQFRTTRHIDGDYVLQTEDAYKHFEDSIAAICDFDRRDYLYEVPFRTLTKTGYPNLITAGRCAAANGYAWDVLRVIPPAIITGQAAGVACSVAIDDNVDITQIDIGKVQQILKKQDVMIHFDDTLIPEKEMDDVQAGAEEHM